MGANLKALSNNKVSILSILAVLVLVVVFVMATTIDNVKVRAPTSGNNYSAGNYTGNIPTLFNATFLNGSGGQGEDVINISLAIANVTFYINISATGWLAIGNSTHCVSYNGVDANISCWAYLNASALSNGSIVSDGYYSVNMTIFNSSTGADILLHGAKAGNLTSIIIDNGEPRTATFTGISSGNNHSTTTLSGNLTLNISADDSIISTSNISFVQFLVFNETGGINGTYVATKEGSSSYWSTSLNASHYIDGTYNITAFVNDTVGNFNRTVNGSTYAANSIILKTIFDNTVPTVSFSCTPTNVKTGDTVTCTCSGSATSGINSTSFTVNPSTSNTGTLTETCSVISKSGLSSSATASYTVELSGGSSGSGGGGASSTTPAATHSHIIGSVDAGQTAKTTVTKTKVSELGVSEIIINVVNKANNVKITVTKLDGKPASVTKEVTGKVYKYMQINVDGITSTNIASSKVKFQAEKSWVTANNIDKNKVSLVHYGGEGEKLPTTLLSEDADNYYYEADAKTFSPFAIVGEEVVPETPEPESTQPEQPTEPKQPSEPSTQPEPMNPLLIVGVIVVVVIVLVGLFMATKKSGKK